MRLGKKGTGEFLYLSNQDPKNTLSFFWRKYLSGSICHLRLLGVEGKEEDSEKGRKENKGNQEEAQMAREDRAEH